LVLGLGEVSDWKNDSVKPIKTDEVQAWRLVAPKK